MEVPYNTGIFKTDEGGGEARRAGRRLAHEARAGWTTRSRELEKAGYTVTSGYTAVRDPAEDEVRLSRRALDTARTWSASASRPSRTSRGVHFQNITEFAQYIEAVERGELPISRAMATTPEERMIRELILQLKLGPRERRRTSARSSASMSMRALSPAVRRSAPPRPARQSQGDWLVLHRARRC